VQKGILGENATMPASTSAAHPVSESIVPAPERPTLIPRPSLLPRAGGTKAKAAPRPRRHEKAGKRAARRPATSAPATVVRHAARKRTHLTDSFKARELLLQYEPLVRKIAGGFQRKLPRNVLREDLIAAGMSGLWDAIRRHGETAGDTFEWYVRVRVRGAILDELRAQDWLPRRARAAAANASAESGEYVPPPAVVRLDDVSEWEQSRCLSDLSSSETVVAAKFTHDSLAKAVEQLPERERHIVSSHYFRGVKFKDLGIELGVSEPRISQLHSRAMRRLKTLMASTQP
jgi:RNA polymerase sigma factor for flagellar operon FliA